MRAEIIATGSELLWGGVLETNSHYLAEELLGLGIETAFKTVVGDSEKDMEECLRIALGRVKVVIVTGGIGPTEDDITRRAVARVTKRRLLVNSGALEAIHAMLASKGKELRKVTDRQALVPAGARLLANPVGTAPGFCYDADETFIAVLPGVPEEMQAMFAAGLKQRLAERTAGAPQVRRKVLHTCGMTESDVNEALKETLKRREPKVGLTAKAGGVDVHFLARGGTAARAKAALERAEKDVRAILGDAVYGADGADLAEIVGALLMRDKRTLAVAESCTGGLIGARITSVAGSSAYFERGFVAYSNRAKTDLLGVPAGLIDRHGAVSREVAEAMASGAREHAGTDLAVAVTGIAGPGGGTAEKPVGLVCLSLAHAGGTTVAEHRFLGTRDQVRRKSAQAALDMVRRHLIA